MKKNKKQTVRDRIFESNTKMVLLLLCIVFLINMAVANLYFEIIENDIIQSVSQLSTEADIKHFIKTYTFHSDFFVFLIVLDAILCVVAFVVISQVFTKKLTKEIMIPLDELSKGATRIQENNLSQDISYQGDLEFENVCSTFNEMQHHILIEKEKNLKYEKARIDMISGISHDLKTPLTVVQGSIKALKDGVVSDDLKQQELLNIAYNRSNEITHLLNQLFYFSKIETGNMPMNIEKVDLVSFLKNYIEDRKYMLNENESIELNCDLKSFVFDLDIIQFTRILDNLFENSKKYAKVVPLEMIIELHIINNKLNISFKDNGKGIDDHSLKLIFDEFYREDPSRNEKEGNGLGLYIVKYLVEAMNGKVMAINENGLSICMTWNLKEGKSIE